jgi:hypothetical protein
MIGARMFAAKKRAEYDVLFKDDPGGRERAELTLGEWLKDHGIIE